MALILWYFFHDFLVHYNSVKCVLLVTGMMKICLLFLLLADLCEVLRRDCVYAPCSTHKLQFFCSLFIFLESRLVSIEKGH